MLANSKTSSQANLQKAAQWIRENWVLSAGILLGFFLIVFAIVQVARQKRPELKVIPVQRMLSSSIEDAEAKLAQSNRNALAPALQAMVKDYQAKAQANRAAINRVDAAVKEVDIRVKKIETTPFDFSKYENQFRPLILDVIRKEGVPVSELSALKREVAQLRANFQKRAVA